MLVAPAGAAEEEAAWKVDVWGHPMEPYAQIPEEIQAGSPGTWSQLEGDPIPKCESIGTLYDTGGGGVTVDALAYELSDHKYDNPGTAWAANPPTRHPPKAEMASFPGGPAAKAACTDGTTGSSAATWGRYLSDSFSFESSSSDTTNKVAAGLVVTETTNKVQGVHVGPMSIGSVLSWLKVEYKPSAEPIVSYRLDITGITDGKSTSGASYAGVTLAGQGIAGKDLAKQFNGQVKGGQSGFKPLGKYGLRVLEPKVGYSRSGRYVFEIAALDGVLGFAARSGQIGEGFGFRLGVSRSAGRYNIGTTTGPHEGYDYMDDPTFGFY
jgi:hypothetical protein